MGTEFNGANPKLKREAAERYARAAVDGVNSDVGMDCDRIIELLKKSLECYEVLGDKREMAGTYSHLAYWHGFNEKAMELYKKSLRLYEEMGDIPGMAMTYRQMAETADNLNVYQNALLYYQKSLTLYEEIKKEDEQAEGFDCYINGSSTIFLTGSKEELQRLTKMAQVSEEHGYYRPDQEMMDRYSKDGCSIILSVIRILDNISRSKRLKDEAINLLMSAEFEQIIAQDIINCWTSWKTMNQTLTS